MTKSCICERRRFIISEFSCEFPQISFNILNDINTVRLDGFRKCSWVRTKRRECLGYDFNFLERNHKDGDEILSHIVRVTGDETSVPFMNVETKEQSEQWMYTHSPSKPTNFKQTLSASQLLCNSSLRQERGPDGGTYVTRDYNNVRNVFRVKQ
jgi:hypothetical protein